MTGIVTGVDNIMANENDEHGRDVRVEARRVPRANRAVVAAYEDWLASASGSTKPPAMAAELMGVLYKLHEADLPSPRREVLAEVIGGAKSKYTVDAIIYAQRAAGHLKLVIETTEGKTKQRDGIRQQRFLRLSKGALNIGKKAEQKG